MTEKWNWIKFIRHKALKKLVDNTDDFSKWLDYLRLKLESPIEYFENIYNLVDLDNSNFYVDPENKITYVKLLLKVWAGVMALKSYKWIPTPLFCYIDYDPHIKQDFNTYGKIDFYGSFFRLWEIWEVDFSFLYEICNNIDMLRVTRIDFRLDFFYKNKTRIPPLKKLIKKRKNVKSKHFHLWKDLESWEYGNRGQSRVFTRMYDKLLDTEVKNKYFLYEDYHNYKSVHRLEFQVERHFCVGYTFWTLLGLEEKVEKSIKLEYDKPIYRKSNTEPDYDNVKYFSNFISRGYSLAKADKNPFKILLWWLIKKMHEEWELSQQQLEKLIEDLFIEYWTYVTSKESKTS